MTTYRRLTVRELRNFDDEAVAMVMGAMDEGCTGRVSSKGHAILRNAAKGTCSLPRNMTAPNRTAQNARADYKTFMQAHAQAVGHKVDTLMVPLARGLLTGREVIVKAYNEEPERFNTFKQEHPGLDMYRDVGVKIVQSRPEFVVLRQPKPEEKAVEPVSKTAPKKARKPMAPRRHEPDPELPGLGACPDGWKPFYGGDAGYDATAYAINEAGTKWMCRWPECRQTFTERRSLGGHQRGHSKQRRAAEAIAAGAASATAVTPIEAAAPDPMRRVSEAVEIVNQVRALLGKDPRVAELEGQIVLLTEERDTAVKHAEELEAKLGLLRETLSL